MIATERVIRNLTWLGTALLLGGAVVVVAGIALTDSIDALITAASIAALAFGVPGAAAFGLAYWLEHLSERAGRKWLASDPHVGEAVRRYAIAVVSVLAAWALRAGLDHYIPGEVPFITFYLAVAFAGWIGGFGPATVATVISAAIAGALYVRPESGNDVGRFALLAIFILVCLGIAAIVSALHEALARAQELAHRQQHGPDSAQTENRLRTLAQSAPAALFMTDSGQACTYCNRAWLALRGRTLAQELGHGWLEGVHAEDLARRREAFAQALATGETRAVGYRLRDAEGAYREVRDVVVAHTDARGARIGLIGACFLVEAAVPAAERDGAAVEPPA